MKKTKLYLWGLLLLLLGIINSCRNDHLQDLQVRNNEQNAKLTSKIISLSQSPHKARLITELNQTKSLMSKTSTNALGKSVIYGDSISINTDEVIFMQNGNYHNYIFRIDKNNPTLGEPFDNLLLTPLPDGSYKEFLIQYYITEQEKQLFLSGIWKIPTSRIKMTELTAGTYNNGQLVQAMSQNCVWTTVVVAYTPCSQDVHFNGEGSSQCDAAIKSQPVYGSYWKCESIDDNPPPGNDPTFPGGNTGGGGGSGSGTPCTTCPTTTTPCVQVPTDPNQPSTGIGDDGCEFIDPFIPNLPHPSTQNPCNKLKNLFATDKANVKPLITGGMYDYINNSSVGEGGIYLQKDALGSFTNEVAPYTGTNSLPPKWDGNYYSIIHTHPNSAYPMFSYSDLVVMYMLEMKGATHNKGAASFILVCEDDNGVKQTYAVVFEAIGLLMEDVWNNPSLAGCSMKEKIAELDKRLEYLYKEEEKKANPNYERAFLQFCFGTNIGLYKANSDLTNWSKLSIAENSETAVVTPTNCN